MVQICKSIPTSPKQAAKRKGALDSSLNIEFFKALGDPTRAKLLACVAKCARPCSVTEVAECCNIDFSVVSRHLAVLARAGILTQSKSGRVVSYEVLYSNVANTLSSLANAFNECCAHRGEGACCE